MGGVDVGFDRPPLPLDGDPSDVRRARDWAALACHEIARSDLIECTRLAVSELVTNAQRHGAPPIVLWLTGTVEEPRFEVHDGSPRLPVERVAGEHESSGRGLLLVARASTAWGVETGADGKAVWFTPARELAAPDALQFVTDGGGARR